MHRRASASSAICRPAAIVDLRGREPAAPRHRCHPGVADGSLSKGETRKIEVDVFSTGPTGDLTVIAGRSSPTFDPYVVTAVSKGVTMTLDKSTAQNGDKLTLTIAVDKTAASTTSRFTVRAILSKDDYHSWPVLLYVP